MYEDQGRMEKLIERKTSAIDWTIVRPPWLRDDIKRRPVKVQNEWLMKGKAMIRREDVAAFIIQHLQTTEWLHKKPTLTY
ncbi:hypothetical protein ATCC90586_007143 [Pythium insidiosum]|nr:hypothetical protein ATCC90586_007143 [Pythium insidiosum]